MSGRGRKRWYLLGRWGCRTRAFASLGEDQFQTSKWLVIVSWSWNIEDCVVVCLMRKPLQFVGLLCYCCVFNLEAIVMVEFLGDCTRSGHISLDYFNIFLYLRDPLGSQDLRGFRLIFPFCGPFSHWSRWRMSAQQPSNKGSFLKEMGLDRLWSWLVIVQNIRSA